MSALSANQLYNLSGASAEGVTFKDWMTHENNLYKSKIEDGKITGKMAFPEWLNKRWSAIAVMNADAKKGILKGKLGQAVKDIAAGVLKKTVNTGAPEGSAQSQEEIAPIEKRILGMKPGVAYTVGAVVLLAGIVGTIYVVRRAKKSA